MFGAPHVFKKGDYMSEFNHPILFCICAAITTVYLILEPLSWIFAVDPLIDSAHFLAVATIASLLIFVIAEDKLKRKKV